MRSVPGADVAATMQRMAGSRCLGEYRPKGVLAAWVNLMDNLVEKMSKGGLVSPSTRTCPSGLARVIISQHVTDRIVNTPLEIVRRSVELTCS